MRRKQAASMKPAPSARKDLSSTSFQWLRETTISPPRTFARAAARPSARLHWKGVMGG